MNKKQELRQVFLPEIDFWKKLIQFAIPIALQNVTVALFGIIDVSIISNMGEVAVSAVSIANQVSFITTNVTFGITSGASVILSRCFGAKDKDGFRKAFAIMLMLSVALNSVIAVASLIVPRQIIAMYTDEVILIPLGATYLVITAVTNIMYGISGSVVSFFRSVGKPSIPMYASLVTVFVKTGLNYLLIYGIGSIPAMGVTGAAIATLLAKLAEVTYYIIMLIRYKEKEYRFQFADLRAIHLKDVGGFVKETAPVIINETMWVLGNSSFNMIFGRMGITAVSAASVSKQLENLCNAFFYGVGIGGCVTVSSMIGQEKHEEAKIAAKRYAVAGFEVGVLIMLLMLGINRPYVYTFFTDLTEETRLVTVGMITVYALYMPFRSMSSAIVIGSLRGLRDSVRAMYYDVLPIYLWAIPIGCLLALVFDLPITVVLAVMMFKRVIKCVLGWRRLYKL